ncbi:MAG: DUF805 domain-containing protein [Bacteroidia bacterium]|nr:DUF805 domain-containing protein [Bacteroidia bacterium]
MKYYFSAWKNYIKFHGRASRSEYWYFTFINIAISVAIHFIAHKAGLKDVLLDGTALGQTVVDLIYLGAVLMPLICVGVRRMQDVNKTGWHLLIPIYGMVLACYDGVEADNKYGIKATY